MLVALPSIAVENASESFLPASVTTFQDDYKIEIEGLLMLDMTTAEGVYADEESLSEASVRRARIGISSDLTKRISAEIAINVDEEFTTDSWHKAAIAYTFTKALSFDAGLMKQPFSMEGSTSSKHLRTLERSLAVDAFTPARGIGVAMTHESSAHFASLGIFQGRNEEDAQDVTARVVWSPMNKKRQVLHFGASINQGDYSGENYQIESSGNIAVSKNFVKSAQYNPETVQTIGIEGAWSRGSLLIQSEWFLQSLTLSTEESEPDFSGGQIQVGWIFGGGYRKYNGQRFGKIAGTQGRRTIELVAGVGVVDVRDADRGDEAREITLGINVQVTKNISVGTQLQSITVQDNNDGQVSGEALQLRLIAEL